MDLTDGAVSYVQKIDLTDSRFNDGKCDPSGRFWAGTMFKKGVKGTAVLYRLDADGSLRTMLAAVALLAIASTGLRPLKRWLYPPESVNFDTLLHLIGDGNAQSTNNLSLEIGGGEAVHSDSPEQP